MTGYAIRKKVRPTERTLPSEVVSSLPVARFKEILAPAFTRSDVRELFEQHGVPKDHITDQIADTFCHSTSGNPTVLSAVARQITALGWEQVVALHRGGAAIAPPGEVLDETMFRLLCTIEDAHARDLLYRLCVIIGSFGANEVLAVASVQPQLAAPMESYSRLLGLWIEQQSSTQVVTCPLIAHFGAQQLASEVEKSVANALATLVFQPRSISPIAFAKGIAYLERAKNGAALGLHLLRGLETAKELPRAWKRLLFLVSTKAGLLDECPLPLAILVKAQQILIARSLGNSTQQLILDAKLLIDHAGPSDQWAVIGYAVQAMPLIAKDNFDEAIRLCSITLSR